MTTSRKQDSLTLQEHVRKILLGSVLRGKREKPVPLWIACIIRSAGPVAVSSHSAHTCTFSQLTSSKATLSPIFITS